MIIRHCLICHAPIKVSPSQLIYKKTCSKVCDAQWRKESGMYAGSNNAAYKGGTVIYSNSQGHSYRYIRGSQHKMPEHRYVMEQHLGRKLNSNEEVHHINADKLDNRIENLIVVPKQTHSRNHFHDSAYIRRLEIENQLLQEKLLSLS